MRRVSSLIRVPKSSVRSLPCVASLERRVVCVGAAVMLALAGAACQPVDRFGGQGEAGGVPPPNERPRLGAPTTGLPGSLEGLLARGGELAAQWQAEPRLAEVWIALDARLEWTEARLTYLAPDADRFLTVHVTPAGTAQERPTLATLGLAPVPEESLTRLPPLPPGTQQPAALARAAGAALERCGVRAAHEVLYATGAPAAWGGSQWADVPEWTATVTGPDGAGAALDPVTGAPVAGGVCLQAAGA